MANKITEKKRAEIFSLVYVVLLIVALAIVTSSNPCQPNPISKWIFVAFPPIVFITGAFFWARYAKDQMKTMALIVFLTLLLWILMYIFTPTATACVLTA